MKKKQLLRSLLGLRSLRERLMWSSKVNVRSRKGTGHAKQFSSTSLLVSITLLIGMAVLMNCHSGEDSDSDSDEFNEQVRLSAYFNQPEEKTQPERRDDSDEEANISEGAGGNTYDCTIRRYAAAPGYNELFVLNPAGPQIFPGSMFIGESMEGGKYTPLSAKRKPLNISVSIVGVNEVAAEATLGEFSLSAFRTARVPLLRSGNLEGLAPTANQVFSVSSLYSNEHFGISSAINIEAQATPTVAFGLDANFSVMKGSEERRFVGKFLHRYYTIDIDLPTDPSDFFEEFPENLGSSPVYVSSVTYGREILLNIQSKRTQNEVSAGLSASLDVSGKLKANASFNTTYQNTIDRSSMQGYVVGGSAGACSALSSGNNLEALNNCIIEGGMKYTEGQPLAYTLRHLRDNSVVRVVLAGSYSARQCTLRAPGPTDQRYFVKSITSSNNDDTGNKALEIGGQIWIEPTTDEAGTNSIKTSCGTKTATNAGKDDATHHHVNVGNKVATAPGNMAASSPALLFNFPGSISVGGEDFNGSGVSVENYNFRSTLFSVSTGTNLSLCGVFRERDAGGGSAGIFGDDFINERIVLPIADLLSGGSFKARFKNKDDGNFWVEFEIIREQ